MSLEIGSDVGPYTVLRPARRESRHARAGATRPPRVWCAEPFAGGEPVALITADPVPAVDSAGEEPAGTSEPVDLGAPLRREWALSGSMRHPHLLTVHDLLDTADGLVLVTDWAAGGSVTELLSGSGRLTAGQTVTLLAGVAQALTACHERGLVHGDVSTDTVLIAGDGRPLLGRIGRSTAAADSGKVCPAEPRCASPDVARGRAATAVDDVFALGATAMESLTGRPAWPAQDLRDVVIQSEFGQWPTIPAAVGAGAELTALVDGMLDADPARRPAVREVLARLADCPPPEPLLHGGSPGERRDPQGRGRHAEPAQVLPARVRAGVPSGPRTSHREPRRDPGRDRDRDRDRDLDRDRVGPARRWRFAIAPVAGLLVLAASAVAGGVWWAGADRPSAANLAAAVDGPVTGADPGAAPPASTSAGPTATSPDWPSVVRDLDRQRSEAFAVGDSTMLGAVYVDGAPGLAVDGSRIERLRAAGLRVTGLTHEISSVEMVDTAAAGPIVEVTEALPSASILDAAGAVVGRTTAVGPIRRLVTLAAVDGDFRIAAVAPGDG